MREEGTLLRCPLCTIKSQVLGRILPNGEVLILRFHSGTTIIQAAKLTLSCYCGYSYMIENGVISGTARLWIV